MYPHAARSGERRKLSSKMMQQNETHSPGNVLEEKSALQRSFARMRGAFVAVGVFSLCVNLLMLTTPLYMLHIFQHVLISGNHETLLYLTVISIFALLILGGLFAARAWMLGRMAGWLNGSLSADLIRAGINHARGNSRPDSRSLHELASIASFLRGSGCTALLDAPWVPIFIACIWYLHPGLGVFSAISALSLITLALNDETVYTHELGAKWYLLPNVHFGAALFHNDYNNPQQRIVETVPGIGVIPLLGNLNCARIIGAEIDLHWSPLAVLDFSLHAAWLDTRIDDKTTIIDVDGGTTVDNNELPHAPDVALSIVGSYERNVTDRLVASLQVDVNYTGDHFISIANLPENEQSFTHVGARVAIRDSSGRWELALFGRNLTNEVHVLFALADQRDYFLSTPRRWGVELGYNY